MEGKDAAAVLKGQADVWNLMFGFADSMTLKCAVELRVADIIQANGGPTSLSKIASSIDSPKVEKRYLARILRFLVRRRVFTMTVGSDGEPIYGLTNSSKWILHDSELTLVPMIVSENHPSMLDPWHYLSRCVKEGGNGFEKAHGMDIFDFSPKEPWYNKLFNNAMACTAKIVISAVLAAYKDGFSNIGTLVDVAGGMGNLVAGIVKAHPHIKGINYDLPHVVSTAPPHDGVTHIGGNMFQSVPNADAIIMKWILHDWSDEESIMILKNCRKAIPKDTGKVLIVECLVNAEGDGVFDDVSLIYDLLMIAHNTGGERTELEWKKILEAAGFPRYRVINIPAYPSSIIEAYPN